jgi:N-glycosylase/DNA lyase
VLVRLSTWSHPRGLLAALVFALTDYQLGTGGANAYWHEIGGLLPNGKELASAKELLKVLEAVVARPVSARMEDQKLARIRRLLQSSFVAAAKAGSLAQLGQNPIPLWYALADAMEQSRDAKTIVFAMKIFDLLHRVSTGRYASFGDAVPIVADLRIARLSFSAGLVTPPPGTSVTAAMSEAGTLLQRDQSVFIEAWSSVSRQAGGLNLFRVDSLAWQLAQPVYDYRHDREQARSTLADILRAVGMPVQIAADLGSELTAALPAR